MRSLVICGIKKCAWTVFYVTSVGTALLYPMLAVPKLVFLVMWGLLSLGASREVEQTIEVGLVMADSGSRWVVLRIRSGEANVPQRTRCRMWGGR
jgi:hypothetical protein